MEDNKKFYREVTLTHPFFKTQKHFVNYCLKVIEGRNINHNILTKTNFKTLAWFLSKYSLFKRKSISNIIDSFTWHISKAEQQERDLFLDKLSPAINELNKLKVDENFTIEDCIYLIKNFELLDEDAIFNLSEGRKDYSSKFVEFVEINCDKKSGVYFLYDKNEELLYVGKSINLKNRLFSTIRERKAFKVKVLFTKNEADCNILEPYYIAKLNPPLNGDLITLDNPTVRILHNFKFTELIDIF
jgi:hypothetical protein